MTKKGDEKRQPTQPQREEVGKIVDQKTHQEIPVVPRKHESPDQAIDRTQEKH